MWSEVIKQIKSFQLQVAFWYVTRMWYQLKQQNTQVQHSETALLMTFMSIEDPCFVSQVISLAQKFAWPAGYPVHMLDTQYRMHPDICRFPSLEFYGGGLKNGPRVSEDTAAPWHAHPARLPSFT